MAIAGVESHDYRKKSLFGSAKEAINSHYEKERAERPGKIKEYNERAKLARAEAGYERAARSRDKARDRGSGGIGLMGGGGIGTMFLGGTQPRRKRKDSDNMFDW